MYTMHELIQRARSKLPIFCMSSYPHETHNPSPVRDSVKDPPNLPDFNVGLQSDKFRLNPDTNPFIPNQRLNINHENDCPESTNSITDNNPDHSTISDLRRLRLI